MLVPTGCNNTAPPVNKPTDSSLASTQKKATNVATTYLNKQYGFSLVFPSLLTKLPSLLRAVLFTIWAHKKVATIRQTDR